MTDWQEGDYGDDTVEPAQAEDQSSLHRRLSGIDLNLLIALEALMDCRNVTHAARKLGQTQPAMSRSLGRLRDLLGDDLLVRSSTGLKPTAYGDYLATVLPAAMLHIRDLISSRPLEAETRLSISNGLTPAVLPYFLKFSGRENEVLKIATHRSADEAMSQLRLRTADFALGGIPSTDTDIESEIVAEEEFVTLVGYNRQGVGGARPSQGAYLSLQQISLVENGREIFPQLGEALYSHGVRRSNMIEIPDVTAAALMVSESELALTVPRSIAGWLSRSLRLSAVVPPVSISPERISLAWLAGACQNKRTRTLNELKASVRDAMAQDNLSVTALRAVERED
ncbi:LysR family transcriptional regulator [Agrobacterium tumefaciens]|uniref:LysR family transcriptional regulator n=1 Tax=Agrobacterium tumefaciens TaxID=358 RepID=UPI002244EA63|nr:LysR family transcriptional regulator [Agrobacterium tumefaciens]MCW8059669.1 LysR family transcriptional regulator [Agrobacterium tumefaciens]MCW8146229.1 LysR family transcriptional regulator [Agrobacterium tumefaciens]